MTTQNAAPAITAIQLRPEDSARFNELTRELREIAARSLDPAWTFVQIQPVEIAIGGARLVGAS